MFASPIKNYWMNYLSYNNKNEFDNDQAFHASHLSDFNSIADSYRNFILKSKEELDRVNEMYFNSLLEKVDFLAHASNLKQDPSKSFDHLISFLHKNDANTKESSSQLYRNSFDNMKTFFEEVVRKSLGTDYSSYYSPEGKSAFQWKPQNPWAQPETANCNHGDCGAHTEVQSAKSEETETKASAKKKQS